MSPVRRAAKSRAAPQRENSALEQQSTLLGNRLPTSVPGVVTRAYGKFFDVELQDEPRTLLSTIKGTLKRERRRTDLIAPGDRVWVTDVGDNEGSIDAVEPRTRTLSRLARNTLDIEQVILANPDQVLFVFAVREPVPHRRMLDRFLVLAESRDLPIGILVNKIDLDLPGPTPDSPSLAHSIFADYEQIYPVHYVSVVTRQGLEAVRAELEGKVTAVAGPSGVGKSSLLNNLDPEGNRVIGEISDATGKGRHTTTATILRRIGHNTFVADTPGIRALAMHGVEPEELDRCFPEFRPFLGECAYFDCTHDHEPGCAIIEAVDSGTISRERYESYLSLRRGDLSG